MLKTISVIMTVMIMSLVVISGNVSAEEYEKNIVLTCESKDININEIPEDRTVDLLVSIENNPGFVFLGMAFDYDKRLDNNGTLDIFNWDYVKILEPEHGKQWKVQPCSFSIFDETGYLLVQTSSVGMNTVYYEDGPLYKLSFRIPDDAVVGDEYNINFVRKDDWNTRLTFLPNDHEKYNDEYFSTLNNGVIRIVGNNQSNSITEPIITEKQEDNFEEKVTYSESEANNESENTEEKAEQTSAITDNSSMITTSYSINSQTSISTKTEESDVISSSSVSLQITSGKPSEASCVTTVSDTVTTLTEINEKSKDEKNILPIIIVSAAVIISGAIFIIIKRRSDND